MRDEPNQPEVDRTPLSWSRVYMRGMRAGFADLGIERCHVCQRDGDGLRTGEKRPDRDERGRQIIWGGGRPHPLSWMSIQPRPALVWHGQPDDGELKMFISTYCRHCYVVTLFDSGSVWSEDHPDLTRLSDEEQDAADPSWRGA